MQDTLYQWNKKGIEQDGVVVGCCKNQEWLLSWWWMNYRMHNAYPVLFIDFGDMTPQAKKWCRDRGELITLDIPVANFVASKKLVAPPDVELWESHINLDVWKARLQWFKKPFACLQSTFARSLWLDLDCQVRKSITPIFQFCENAEGIAIAEEPLIILQEHERSGLIQLGEMEYNGGVIVFKHSSTIIQDWAKECVETNSVVRGDQEALSRLAHKRKIQLPSLPPIYNHRWYLRFSPSFVIIHWLGTGKEIIQSKISALESNFFMNFSIGRKSRLRRKNSL